MGKSIAKQVMAIADKREAERLKELKPLILEEVKNHFQFLISRFEYWCYETSTLFIKPSRLERGGISNDEITSLDFCTVCADLGFNISTSYGGHYMLSIPKWINGEKRTPAQLLVYHANMEINRNIKADRAAAREVCTKVMQRLTAGEFEVLKIDRSENKTTYTIQVAVFSDLSHTKYFEREVNEFLNKKGISLSNVWSSFWTLTLHK